MLEAVHPVLVERQGASLSLSLKPKGDVNLGALLAANRGGPEMLSFVTDQMKASITVTP